MATLALPDPPWEESKPTDQPGGRGAAHGSAGPSAGAACRSAWLLVPNWEA
jgi:hypothetical protein